MNNILHYLATVRVEKTGNGSIYTRERRGQRTVFVLQE